MIQALGLIKTFSTTNEYSCIIGVHSVKTTSMKRAFDYPLVDKPHDFVKLYMLFMTLYMFADAYGLLSASA